MRTKEIRKDMRKIIKISMFNFKLSITFIMVGIFCYCNAPEKSKSKQIIDGQINTAVIMCKDFKECMSAMRLEKMQLIIKGQHGCDDINKQISTNLSILRYIYNKRLRKNPGTVGWIGFQFYIKSNGNVFKTEVIETTVNDNILVDSLKNVINDWTFKPLNLADTTVVYFPFCCGSFCGSYTEIICNGKTLQSQNDI
jgi:hypothetical protein